MSKNSLTVVIGLISAVISGSALGAGPTHPAGNESGTVYHGPQYAKTDGRWTRADTWNTPSRALLSPTADDGWEFIGGESGWQLRQHGYDFRNGRLAHTDNLPHDTPKPGSGDQDWAARHIGSGS